MGQIRKFNLKVIQKNIDWFQKRNAFIKVVYTNGYTIPIQDYPFLEENDWWNPHRGRFHYRKLVLDFLYAVKESIRKGLSVPDDGEHKLIVVRLRNNNYSVIDVYVSFPDRKLNVTKNNTIV